MSDSVFTRAEVVEVLSHRHGRGRLKNGKEVVLHLARADVEAGVRLRAGEMVRVKMTVYDFSKARVTGAD